jgi:hypothetical protein
MATDGTTGRMTRAYKGGSRMNLTLKRSLAVGILSAALMFGVGTGMAAQEDGSVALVPGETPDSAPYRLSPPNELLTEGSAQSIPTSSVPYRLSAPNELNPHALPLRGLSGSELYPYRLSPPNEVNPTGP